MEPGTLKLYEWREQRAILMRGFDYWRKEIINGDRTYDARDWFEKVLDYFEPKEYLKEKDEMGKRK